MGSKIRNKHRKIKQKIQNKIRSLKSNSNVSQRKAKESKITVKRNDLRGRFIGKYYCGE